MAVNFERLMEEKKETLKRRGDVKRVRELEQEMKAQDSFASFKAVTNGKPFSFKWLMEHLVAPTIKFKAF